MEDRCDRRVDDVIKKGLSFAWMLARLERASEHRIHRIGVSGIASQTIHITYLLPSPWNECVGKELRSYCTTREFVVLT